MSNQITLDVARQRGANGPNIRIHAHRGAHIAVQVVRFAGCVIGVLVFATMAVLEPFVRFLLMTSASMGMFVTIVFGFLIRAEGFPKWFMLAMSVACFLVLATYYGVMSIFGNVGNERNLR